MQPSRRSDLTSLPGDRWQTPGFDPTDWRQQRIDVVASIGAAMTRQQANGAIKIWEDLERYEAIIDRTHPDLIVECGTYRGVSAGWFADAGRCPVITVDIAPEVQYPVFKSWEGRVKQVIGSSVDPAVVSEVMALAVGHERIMVTLDSDHSAAHVRAEMAAYAPLVTPGCYLVVEDTLVRWMPWFGIEGSPYDAVDEWLETHTDWEADLALDELHPVTQHPCGFLRRRR